MKKQLFFGLLAILLAVGFTACGSNGAGPGDPWDGKTVAAEWRKTMDNGDGVCELDENPSSRFYNVNIAIDETTITFTGGDLGANVKTISGVYTEEGGMVTVSGPGKWAYVCKAGEKLGFIIKYTGTTYGLLMGGQATDLVGIYNTNYVPDPAIDITGIADYPAVCGSCMD